MNMQVRRGSLIERAAEIYDFGRHLSGPSGDPVPPITIEQIAPATPSAGPAAFVPPPAPAGYPPVVRPDARIVDRALLAERGLLVPGAPVGALAEEFRLIKRHLLTTARDVYAARPHAARTILVCAAQPDDGKTYCAVNLAISMAAERDIEVLLVDADFAKPDVMTRLGLADGPGLLDALADPALDPETLVVPTDIPHLSVMPAGTKTHADTELVASLRTAEVIARLLDADGDRLIILDSPPALAASPASVLATHAGQVMLVVRADKTRESDLREAVELLDACEHIQLVLNALAHSPGGRRYGAYYRHNEEEAA